MFFSKERDREDLKKYILRIGKLYLIWSVAFLPMVFRGGAVNWGRLLQDILFSGTYWHLWFLPSLIVAISIVWVLSKLLGNKVLLTISLALYFIGTLVDTYSFIHPMFEWSVYKTIFLTTRNGLFFGCLFIIIGKFIADGHRAKMWYGLCGVTLMIIEGYYHAINSTTIVNMTFVSIILVPIILSLAIDNPGTTININGKFCREVSTVLFCCHPYIIRIVGFIGKRMGMNGFFMTIGVVLISLTGAAVVVKLSDRIKLLRHLY